jgi:hypothetical protein
MKRACLPSVVVFVVLFAGYFVFLNPHVGAPGVYFLSLFGALSMTMLGGSLWGLRDALRNSAALRREKRGEPLRDNRWEAVSGPINPRGEPLLSPFGGMACVAYEYDVEKTTATPSRDNPTATESPVFGWALTPCAIHSSRGQVGLWGWPLLDAFPQVDESGPAARDRAERYMRETSFQKVRKHQALRLLSMMEESIVDPDGVIRTDCRFTDEPDPLQGRRLKERIVPWGEPVTAFGLYSLSRGGFSPRPGQLATANRLFPGIGETVRAGLWRKAFSTLAFAVVFFLFFHGILAVVLFVPGKTSPAPRPPAEAVPPPGS